MKLKSLITLAACACSLLALGKSSTPKGFTDDLDAALADAKKSGKYVYACFSGSDWCGWCVKLEKEVFSDKEFDFVDALKDDYLFVFIDSPNDKSLLSEAAKERNPKLTEKYQIQGFPTALILTGAGETVEQTGYRAGGAQKYVEFLKDVRKNGATLIEKQKKLAEQKKREKEIKDKYFVSFEKKLDAALKGLQKEKPSAEDFLKAAESVEAVLKDIKAVKIDDADKELGGQLKEQLTGGVERLVRILQQNAEKGKAKTEKGKAKAEKGKAKAEKGKAKVKKDAEAK